MAFEITDLMIQVVTGSAHADADQPSACRQGHTCPDNPATSCRKDVTCIEATACRQGGHTCKQIKTDCQANVTCRSGEQTSAETDLDALLAQLRATLAAETAAV